MRYLFGEGKYYNDYRDVQCQNHFLRKRADAADVTLIYLTVKCSDCYGKGGGYSSADE